VRASINTESHAAEIADLLFYEDLKDVVLAGTSTGGMVMARAAELARNPWINGLFGHRPRRKRGENCAGR
jgi:hypothetical protein